MFTYEEANRRYTERYSHTDWEKDADGLPVQVEYRPISICTNSEMDAIFKMCHSWNDVLEAMHSRIGEPGPKVAKSSLKDNPHI